MGSWCIFVAKLGRRRDVNVELLLVLSKALRLHDGFSGSLSAIILHVCRIKFPIRSKNENFSYTRNSDAVLGLGFKVACSNPEPKPRITRKRQKAAELGSLLVIFLHCVGFRVLGFGFWVLGFGFWVLGFGFWVLGLGWGGGGAGPASSLAEGPTFNAASVFPRDRPFTLRGRIATQSLQCVHQPDMCCASLGL